MDWIELVALLWLKFPALSLEEFKNIAKGPRERNFLLRQVSSKQIKEYIKKQGRFWWEDLESQITNFKSKGGKYSIFGSKDFPVEFYSIPNPPLSITYFGEPIWNHEDCISIVGSRKPTNLFVEWMDEELSDISKSKVIVSGAARGVDQKAHSISLKNSRPTIALIPSGLNRLYPKGFEDWVPHILKKGGALLSEYLPDQDMYKGYFQQRNRLIVALSPLLVVVQAQKRSGSLMSARLALESNKVIATVPAFAKDHFSAGNNQLLIDGALIVRDRYDLESIVSLNYF